MKKKCIALLFFVFCLLTSPAYALRYEFASYMSSDQVIGGGKPGISALGAVKIYDDSWQLNWSIDSNTGGLDLPSVAKIYKGDYGQLGSLVLDLGCCSSGSFLATDVLADVIANPKNYYLELSSTNYPSGVVRGQLSPLPIPRTILLFVLGLTGLWLLRRPNVSRSIHPLNPMGILFFGMGRGP
jgi:hypothetical protein